MAPTHVRQQVETLHEPLPGGAAPCLRTTIRNSRAFPTRFSRTLYPATCPTSPHDMTPSPAASSMPYLCARIFLPASGDPKSTPDRPLCRTQHPLRANPELMTKRYGQKDAAHSQDIDPRATRRLFTAERLIWNLWRRIKTTDGHRYRKRGAALWRWNRRKF